MTEDDDMPMHAPPEDGAPEDGRLGSGRPIVCVGWISLDVIGKVATFPTPQMHASADDFDAACGGRAASQAMAICAVEGVVSLIARVGSDTNADLLQAELIELGIDAEYVEAAPAPTGMRMVAEQADGQQLT